MSDGDGSALLEDTPDFDEAAFLKGVKRRSLGRAFAVALATVLLVGGVMFAAAIAWRSGIYERWGRIDEYYGRLTRISNPNTLVVSAGPIEFRFPGARSVYAAYRLVGDRTMPVGSPSVEYGIWGREQWQGLTSGEQNVPPWQGRRFTGQLLAPALRFRYPQSAESASADPIDQDYVAKLEAGLADERDRARRSLASAPASATAELAVSFVDLKSYEQMQSMLASTGAELYWGAVDVWGKGHGPADPGPGDVVGIGFVNADPSLRANAAVPPDLPADLEKALPGELEDIAFHMPQGTADLLKESAGYVRQNGVSYWGAVVEGTPKQLAPIIDSNQVSAVSLGFVVMPWD